MKKIIDIKNLLIEASSCGIRFVMMRHEDSVKDTISSGTGDIDIYVMSQDYERFCIFLNSKKYFNLPGRQVFKNPDSKLAIDVHHDFYKRLPFLTEAQIFLHTRNISGIEYLSQENLFLVLLLHPLDITGIRGSRVYTNEKLHYLKKNLHLISSSNIKKILNKWIGPISSKMLLKLAKNDLNKIVYSVSILKIFSLLQSHQMRKYFFMRVKSKLTGPLDQKKLLIAVMGVDGSGKTTLIKGIENFINEFNTKDSCRTLYLGSLGGYVLPYRVAYNFYRFFSKKKNTLSKDLLESSKESPKSKSKVAIVGFGVFLTFEYFVRRTILFWNTTILRKYVLLDRYFFDASRKGVDHPILKTISNFFPIPSNLIYLNGSAKIFFERKGEYSPEILSMHQLDTLNILKKDYKGNLHIIDASKKQERVLEDSISTLFGYTKLK